MTNSAIVLISQIATINNCQNEKSILCILYLVAPSMFKIMAVLNVDKLILYQYVGAKSLERSSAPQKLCLQLVFQRRGSLAQIAMLFRCWSVFDAQGPTALSKHASCAYEHVQRGGCSTNLGRNSSICSVHCKRMQTTTYVCRQVYSQTTLLQLDMSGCCFPSVHSLYNSYKQLCIQVLSSQ